MAVAYSMVDTLKKAGRSPTRASVLRAATHLNETNPFLLPGVRIQTSPNDYYPMDKVKLARYRGTTGSSSETWSVRRVSLNNRGKFASNGWVFLISK